MLSVYFLPYFGPVFIELFSFWSVFYRLQSPLRQIYDLGLQDKNNTDVTNRKGSHLGPHVKFYNFIWLHLAGIFYDFSTLLSNFETLQKVCVFCVPIGENKVVKLTRSTWSNVGQKDRKVTLALKGICYSGTFTTSFPCFPEAHQRFDSIPKVLNASHLPVKSLRTQVAQASL